jgi:hypothetical protein
MAKPGHGCMGCPAIALGTLGGGVLGFLTFGIVPGLISGFILGLIIHALGGCGKGYGE